MTNELGTYNHYIKYVDDSGKTKTFYLTIPEDYTFGGDNIIIVKESATGDGAIVINNGRTQEEISVNGTLFASNPDNLLQTSRSNPGGIKELNANIKTLMDIKDKSKIIEFIKPFKVENRSNQYYIKSLRFNTINDTNSIGFSMILTENRTANIRSYRKDMSQMSYVKRLRDAYLVLEGIQDGSTDYTGTTIDVDSEYLITDYTDITKEELWDGYQNLFLIDRKDKEKTAAVFTAISTFVDLVQASVFYVSYGFNFKMCKYFVSLNLKVEKKEIKKSEAEKLFMDYYLELLAKKDPSLVYDTSFYGAIHETNSNQNLEVPEIVKLANYEFYTNTTTIPEPVSVQTR